MKSNMNDNVKHKGLQILKNSLLDIALHHELRFREDDINDLLAEFLDAKVEILDDYCNLTGSYHNSTIQMSFNQKVVIDECYSMKAVYLKLTDISAPSIMSNTIAVELDTIKGFRDFINYQQNNMLLSALTVDSLVIQQGALNIISNDKLAVTIQENYLNYLIGTILVGKYGVKSLNVTLKEDCFNVKGIIEQPEFIIRFDKDIKISSIDLYNEKRIILGFVGDDLGNTSLGIEIDLFIDNIHTFHKYMSKKIFGIKLEPVIKALVFTSNNRIKCDGGKRSILFYKKN